jgi:hypothetical protein
MAWDQVVLTYILSTLTGRTLMHVSQCTTSATVWSTLADLYSSHMPVHSINAWITLATTKKNQLSVTNYYAKMSSFVDDLVASGTPLSDDEFVAYLLADLDEDYNQCLLSLSLGLIQSPPANCTPSC